MSQVPSVAETQLTGDCGANPEICGRELVHGSIASYNNIGLVKRTAILFHESLVSRYSNPSQLTSAS